jgi:maltooligosyltrehalose trehalohydrolase
LVASLVSARMLVTNVKKEDRKARRRYPIGAEVIGKNQTHFRVWAPKARTLDVVVEDKPDSNRTFHSLTREQGGYFSGAVKVGAGTSYRFQINGSETYPDPASRFQPDGPHAASCVVDSAKFQWSDSPWHGITMKGQVIYEMHIGTFTKEGMWRGAAEQLPELARIGITVIEMMPVADFAGDFGWGYDGVNLFAPSHLYGTPDDLRAFIDDAHSLGLGVILDVVYNHFGPDGNYLGTFSDDYVVKEGDNEWGDAINFDGRNSGPVREFFITNACYWIEEFHFDGFRFDATHAIQDRSEEHIISEIGRAAREAAGSRSIILTAENERQETRLIRPHSEGGCGLDAVWNDDFHHSAVVALTGRREAYYTDYLGRPQEFISAAKYGYLFQGQPYVWQEAPRGTSAFGAAPESFVAFIENHDQVANTAAGERLRFSTAPGKYRAMTALLLLGPWTPLLFQGDEFGASSPFLYFSDVGDAELKEAVRKGRFKFLSQFPSLATDEAQKRLPVPFDPNGFERCKLDLTERQKNKQLYDLHIDLLTLRREDSRFRMQLPGKVDGAVLGPASFVLRYFDDGKDDRLLLVNLGARHELVPAPEPLLAPSVGFEWQTLWSSEAARYGGPGETTVATQLKWILPAEAAVAFQLVPEHAPPPKPKSKDR